MSRPTHRASELLSSGTVGECTARFVCRSVSSREDAEKQAIQAGRRLRVLSAAAGPAPSHSRRGPPEHPPLKPRVLQLPPKISFSTLRPDGPSFVSEGSFFRWSFVINQFRPTPSAFGVQIEAGKPLRSGPHPPGRLARKKEPAHHRQTRGRPWCEPDRHVPGDTGLPWRATGL